jgi:hypothetical protein
LREEGERDLWDRGGAENEPKEQKERCEKALLRIALERARQETLPVKSGTQQDRERKREKASAEQ